MKNQASTEIVIMIGMTEIIIFSLPQIFEYFEFLIFLI